MTGRKAVADRINGKTRNNTATSEFQSSTRPTGPHYCLFNSSRHCIWNSHITIYHECMGLCSSSLGSAGQSSWITTISLNKLILNFNFSLRGDQCLHYLMVYNQVTMLLGLNLKKHYSKRQSVCLCFKPWTSSQARAPSVLHNCNLDQCCPFKSISPVLHTSAKWVRSCI